MDTPIRLDHLSAQKKALFELLRKNRQQEKVLQTQVIMRAEKREFFPLSFAQQRLWFINQLESGRPIYNIPTAMRLIGVIDSSVLGRAFSEVIKRHEALRTSFHAINGQAVQFIEPPKQIVLELENLSHLPLDDREAEAYRIAREEANTSFDLSQGPPLRIRLLRLDIENHVLLYTVHHIAADAWSTGILVKELAILYDAFAKNEGSPLAELPIQYADYAVWQREYLQKETLDRELDYWKHQLEGAPPILTLPTDRLRPAIQTYAGTTHLMTVSSELTAKLKQVALGENTTLFMILLATFNVLLRRYANQTDIVIGTPIAGRNQAETEKLIGFFVNTLVLRTRIREEDIFRDLLAQVKETCLGAYAHQETPLEKLVEELNPDRVLSHAPVFQVTFDLQSMRREDLEVKGLKFSPLKIEDRSIRHYLSLNIIEQEKGLYFFAHYNRDLFDVSTIERMMGQYNFLLESISADIGQIVRDLALLKPTERKQILVEWNQTEREFPQNLCLHHLFEDQVERTPHATAIQCGAAIISYSELNRRANQLAHYLQKLGVGPETIVGLSTSQSFELMVGILGILKAGGVYMPLDSAYPLERLAFMQLDAGLAFLLTQEEIIDRLPPSFGQEVLLDADWERIEMERDENPSSEVSSDNLAYVIYTSGSTGQPKGSLLEHQGACNLALMQIEKFEIDESSRVLQFASPSFDASIWEIFSTLLAGATLCLTDRSALIPSQEMLSFLRDEEISFLTLPPSVLAALPTGELPALKTMVVAGESCSADIISRWATRCHFINAYGPTEATVCATLCNQVEQDRPSIIGRPISNANIYIMDEWLRAIPIGVSGQIYIGGAGIARGYLNRAEMTAEQFCPHLHSHIAGERLYATGDLARYLSDGRIEFIGRIDQQVKIRGFRIEPSEINAAIEAHPFVQQSRVLIRDTANGDKQLVAYIIPEQSQKEVPETIKSVIITDPEENNGYQSYFHRSNRSISEKEDFNRTQLTTKHLNDYLKARLPAYMVPASYILLPGFPLSPNGKVDYSQLPAVASEEIADYVTKDAPQTPIEELLEGIWANILGKKSIGRHEDFFELGGHSLLATQVVSRIREVLQDDIPLRSLFEAKTITELARIIEAQQDSSVKMESLQLTPITRDGPLPLSFAQQRLWFIDQYEPGGAFYNISVAVRLQGSLHIGTLERTLNEIIRRHEVLRTSFIQIDGEPWQVISPTASLPLNFTDLSNISGAERETEIKRLARNEALQPFDLSSGRLLRVKLIRVGDENHVAVFTVHHIVCDGWSMSILVREISAVYTAFAHDEPSPLPELAIQYADFAHWQRSWLQGEVLDSQLQYWRQQLSEATVVELPTDRPRPVTQTFRGASRSLMLTSLLNESLKDLSRREGCTLFITLLAAFQTVLRCYTGSNDIVIGTDVANRNRSEIESLIGFFVNQLVMRTQLSGNYSFQELLSEVREIALGAYAHQDLPFDRLVDAINPERDLSRTPIFQIKMLLQNTLRENLELPGLALQRIEFESGISRFDLVLSFTDSSNGLLALIGYNTDLFDQVTINRLLGHVQSILEQVVANPELCLSQLSMLTHAERRQALIEWNQTERSYPEAICLHQLFEEQVARTPDAVALIFDEVSISYHQLDSQANRLSCSLHSLGVGRGVLVGVCFDRSIEMVVAILGVLKASGAYLPMDPTYPLSRLAYIVEDGQTPVLLTQRRLVERLPAHWGQIICLDEELELDQVWGEVSESTMTPDDLAYVVYTSGSTGNPKGVMVSHQSLVHRVLSMIDDYYLDAASRMLNFVSLGFDAFVEEIFPILAVGGGIVILPNPSQMSPRELLSECMRYGVNSLHFPSVYWSQILEELLASGETVPDWIKLIIIGGENTSIDKMRMWADLNHHFSRLFNAYGPTEATVTATTFHVPLNSSILKGLIGLPAGCPLANTQIYVLNQDWQLMPVGVTGELYIGGVGVAKGYRNKPDLSAESFIPNPFSSIGGRLYRTGDLTRYLMDGKIEIIGRRDGQVKIRGYRIETDEIAVALEKYFAVEKALVTAFHDSNGDMRLAAYLLPRVAVPCELAEVRSFIRGILPEYMIPSTFILLKNLPLTSHGKIDHSQLPTPGVSEITSERSDEPRNEIERTLTAVWQGVMNIDQIGVHSNFFDLNGNSLMAIKVMARVREVFHVDLPVRVLFESLTVAELAKVIEKERNAGNLMPNIPLVKVPRERRLPLSFSQQRLWFIDQLEPGLPIYNCPGAFHLSGPLQIEILEKSLSEVIRRHEILRTSFNSEQGEPWQVIHQAEKITLGVTDLSSLPEDKHVNEINRLTTEEALLPFNLATGPLLRISILRLRPDEHTILFTLHHIVGDGWSIMILFREVVTLYEAFTHNQVSPLPELSVQYADFANWQQESMQHGALAAELDYWRQQLGGELPIIQLPFASNRQTNHSYRGARFAFDLSADTSHRLRVLSRSKEATLFMTLLAVFKTLLYHYTQLDDIIVGTAHAGRNRIEIENLIGFFINMLVLRTDLSGNPTFLELLDRVRDVTLGAFANQNIPFEKLVEECRVEKQREHSPIFQVAFSLENLSQLSPEGFAPVTTQHLSDLKISPQKFEVDTVRYDLTLWLKDDGKNLYGWWNYNTDLFDVATIKRMQGHFETLLDNVLDNSNARIDELEFLTLVEKQQKIQEAQHAEENERKKFFNVKPRSIMLAEVKQEQSVDDASNDISTLS